MLKSPHQHLYKNEARSPAALRDTLRKQCWSKIREVRFDRQNARRTLNFDGMKKFLLETVETEMKDESPERKVAMIEELQRECEEYEAQLDLEEEALLSHLDPDAFCPSCKLSPMDVGAIGCLCKNTQCNFGFVFKNGFTPSQAELAEMLFNAFRRHGETECPGMLDPCDTSEGLFLKCDTCKKSEQIL